jgi:hypothetical protein
MQILKYHYNHFLCIEIMPTNIGELIAKIAFDILMFSFKILKNLFSQDPFIILEETSVLQRYENETDQ